MRLRIEAIDFFERDVRLRLPFRFGVVTLTEAPQAFVQARIRLENGKEAQGGAAELLAPKWFDKDPALTNEQNFEQLRAALRLARDAYLAAGENTAFAHSMSVYAPHRDVAAKQGLNGLVAGFGPALIDRAVLDALCRANDVSFYRAMRSNLPGISVEENLDQLGAAGTIAARHTVGLVDPITDRDVKNRVGDGLPETLEEVINRYGHRYFKLKVGGELRADVERLAAIASVLDRIPDAYHATLDGNEQYSDVDGIVALWSKMKSEPRLRRLVSSVLFVEQPVKRARALQASIKPLADQIPVIIDESDDSLDAFVQARRLGYGGVSSKTCKGLYKSILNWARCRQWNREEGSSRYFMSGEDLTIQPGLALQQDLALVSLLGLGHVERNGHHYVNGMADIPDDEQRRFLAAHEDVYERSHGAVRLRIEKGTIRMQSLDCVGYASRALPDWHSMRNWT